MIGRTGTFCVPCLDIDDHFHFTAGEGDELTRTISDADAEISICIREVMKVDDVFKVRPRVVGGVKAVIGSDGDNKRSMGS